MATHHGTDAENRTQAALLNDGDFLRTLVERMLQQLLETEMTAHVGAEPYERTEARTGHRNGARSRTLHTRVGTLMLMVPQDREGTFSTQLFGRYQRSEKALVLALMEMYLEGVDQATAERQLRTTFHTCQTYVVPYAITIWMVPWRARTAAPI
jgi:putative transposase